MESDNESATSNDIKVDAGDVNDFFFMDTDEEQEKYGASTKVPQALLSSNVAKEVQTEKVSIFGVFNPLQANKVKQIMEFKVRVLDFLSIYAKEMKTQNKPYDTHFLMKGLLKSLQVAHQDKNTILFDRIKTVLSMLAKGGAQQQPVSDDKDSKMLLTEVMALVLKPTKDQKMHNAYVDVFISLTKQFSADPKTAKFVSFTYKELFKKFLGGRGTSAHSLNQQFFVRIFEECNSALAKSVMKPLLKYLLPPGKQADFGDSAENSRKSSGQIESDKTSSRSSHQRLLAIEIFNSLVKSSMKNPELLVTLGQNTDLISGVLIQIVHQSQTFGQKKVKKTMLALNIYTKLGKALKSGQNMTKYHKDYIQNGLKISKAIEKECEVDKAMSNLKGKVKEIKAIVENME